MPQKKQKNLLVYNAEKEREKCKKYVVTRLKQCGLRIYNQVETFVQRIDLNKKILSSSK